MKIFLKEKRGVALLWTMIISLIMLTISGSMAGYIAKESRSSVLIEESVQAYAAAKTGADWGVWCQKHCNSVPTTQTLTIGNVTVVVTINASGVDSVGTFGTSSGVVRRAIHTEIVSRATPPPIDLSISAPILPSNTNSFTLQFDFWRKSSTSTFYFGTQNSSGYPSLYMNVDSAGKVQLIEKTSAVTSISSGPIDLSGDVLRQAEPYRYRAVIKYIDNISATIEIFKKDIGADPMDSTKTIEIFTSYGSKSINLIGVNLNDQNRLFISTPKSYVLTGGPEGDGEYLLINTNNFIDHIVLNR